MVQGGKEKTVGRDVTVEEVMEEVMKDSAYYRRSGGGLSSPAANVSFSRILRELSFVRQRERPPYGH